MIENSVTSALHEAVVRQLHKLVELQAQPAIDSQMHEALLVRIAQLEEDLAKGVPQREWLREYDQRWREATEHALQIQEETMLMIHQERVLYEARIADLEKQEKH